MQLLVKIGFYEYIWNFKHSEHFKLCVLKTKTVPVADPFNNDSNTEKTALQTLSLLLAAFD